MKNWRWLTSIVVILIMVVLIGATGVIMAKKHTTSPEVGFIAPNFTLTTMQGKKLTLSQFRGKPVYINFFASWCPPCQFETPDVEKMYKQYGHKITFIGVNLTFNDSVPKLKQFVKKYGVTYPVMLDSKGSVTQMYNVMAIPTSIFVEPNGVIQTRYEGAMIAQQMQTYFTKLLKSS